MPDWVLATIGPVCLLLGFGVSELRQWRQERDRYKFMTFEKRLTVHQEAYKLTSDIGQLFFDLLTGEGMPSGGELGPDVADMRKWWRGNCLWLDKASRKIFLDFINSVERYAESYDSEDAQKCFDLVETTTKTIVRGIGEQYLPDVHPKSKKVS